jgi:ubiquinone/menaquinone biosynthesis C-methylase UbiE
LIEIAKTETLKEDNKSNVNFVVSDMLSFLEKQDQQSYDFVIAVASFQHISKKYERLLILKNIYRVLEYDGVCQMFNWSFSTWFFKKYSA